MSIRTGSTVLQIVNPAAKQASVGVHMGEVQLGTKMDFEMLLLKVNIKYPVPSFDVEK